MTRQEQHDKLQAAQKQLYAAARLIREARAGGDIPALPIFGKMQVGHEKVMEGLELLAESCHTIRKAGVVA